eukprot:1288048-Prymnesium_polylepis.4
MATSRPTMATSRPTMATPRGWSRRSWRRASNRSSNHSDSNHLVIKPFGLESSDHQTIRTQSLPRHWLVEQSVQAQSLVIIGNHCLGAGGARGALLDCTDCPIMA